MRKYLVAVLALAVTIFGAPGCQQEEPEPAPLTPLDLGVNELDSGLTVILESRDDAPLVTIALRCDAGINREGREESGFSSLLVRILSDDGDSPSSLLEALGASLSVGPSPDALTLSTTVLSDDAPEACEAIFQALSLDVSDKRVLLHRDILLSNLRVASQSPESQALDKINAALFPRLPYGDSIQDKIESLENMSADSFRDFVGRCVRPEETIIAVVGELTPELRLKLRELAEGWQLDDPEEEVSLDRETDEQMGGLQIIPREGDTVTLYLARRLPQSEAKEYYTYRAVNFILNGVTSVGLIRDARLARLQRQLALDRPPVSTLQMMREGSNQIIRADIPAPRAGEISDVLMGELRILYSSITGESEILDQEISDAKHSFEGWLLRSNETTSRRAEFILWSEWYGFGSHEASYHRRQIQKLDKERILELIGEEFEPLIATLVAVGPERTLRAQFNRD